MGFLDRFSGASRIAHAASAINNEIAQENAALREAAAAPVVVTLSDLGAAPARYQFHDGEPYPGAFGFTDVLVTDYWTLRARSSALFKLNLFARALVRRLVINEISTGLFLEATPEESLLGYEVDALADWAEETECLFTLWADNAQLCDVTELSSFGTIQASARLESLVAGDVLAIIVSDPRTGLPRVRLINGAAVRTPTKKPAGNTIKHGVELDSDGRHVAFWITKSAKDGMFDEFERIPAYGPRTGRKIAWLVYGTDKRVDDVRGEPLLSIMLSSLKGLDGYREAVLRKADLASRLALSVERDVDAGLSSLPFGRASIVRDTEVAPAASSTSAQPTYNVERFLPGTIIDRLAPGETIKHHGSQATDEKYGEFEAAMLNSMAFCCNVPPEIFRLSFSSNYSASQAATNEMKLYLNVVREWFGSQFCKPIYHDWLLSQALNKRLKMPGFLESWRDRSKYETYCSWNSCDWSGQIKLAIDITKLAKGYEVMRDNGWMTNRRAARELSGTKFSRNLRELKRENEALREVREALAPEPMAPPQSAAVPAQDDEDAQSASVTEAVVSAVADILDDAGLN